MIPSVLKNVNAFVDGRGYAGRVEELVPPKLVRKMEAYRGGGMDAEMDLDMGHEKLEASLTLAEHDPEILKLWGITNHSAVALQFRGAMQRDSDGVVVPVIIDIRGRFREIDPGTWKAGEKVGMVCAISATYYKMRVDGADVIEIDVPNMVCTVDGVDLLAAQRSALGL